MSGCDPSTSQLSKAEFISAPFTFSFFFSIWLFLPFLYYFLFHLNLSTRIVGRIHQEFRSLIFPQSHHEPLCEGTPDVDLTCSTRHVLCDSQLLDLRELDETVFRVQGIVSTTDGL